MKNFSFLLLLLLLPFALLGGENRVDQYPPYTNIRLMGPPNTPASILNDIYIDGPKGGGVLGYVSNPNDDQFISQNSQMIALLSMMAYSEGDGIPQNLYIDGDSIGIDGGNKVFQKTWGNYNDTISEDRIINLPSDKSFMIKSDEFSFRLNTPYGEGGLFSGFTTFDSTLGVNFLNGQLYEMSDTNLAVFDSKSNIMATISGNPFPLENPLAYGTSIYNRQTKEIDDGDTIVYQLISLLEKKPGVFKITNFNLGEGNVYILQQDLMAGKISQFGISDNQIKIFTSLDETITSSISLDSLTKTVGAFSNSSTQINTSGGSDTIENNVRTYLYNPPSLQTGVTLHLPLSPADGQYITIIGGGTITIGNVVSGITLTDHNGSGVIGFGSSDMQAGPLGTFQWIASANKWYQVSF
ncbi:MAG TPA: hypothetical protein VLZ75_02980 [Chitinophagales bacterium]|nr:hypothetical protein [Chitinophagales bacterium]